MADQLTKYLIERIESAYPSCVQNILFSFTIIVTKFHLGQRFLDQRKVLRGLCTSASLDTLCTYLTKYHLAKALRISESKVFCFSNMTLPLRYGLIYLFVVTNGTRDTLLLSRW
jgi:hypothetical protein